MSVETYHSFFKRVTGKPSPYDYQCRLACGPEAKADDPETLKTGTDCRSQLIDIPTGLGKTAAVVLAWLWNRIAHPDAKHRDGWPRRLVICLPMRTLVEQTHENVADWLRRFDNREWQPGTDHKGKVGLHLLMGGADAGEWDIYPEADAILIGTQDMLLSRALNRGYGMTRYRWPMHFGLLNNDCLWVFDEVQLMGAGLPTTTQIAGFRETFGASGKCLSWWMSATTERDWLRTVDFNEPDALPRISLLEKERKDLEHLLSAPKRLEMAKNTAADLKKLASEIVDAAEKCDGLTLVVVNTVKTARLLHAAVRKLSKKPVAVGAILLHSRFRPDDRERVVDEVVSAELTRRLVISTQVIEAGVDVSAATLFTELAPWSSLVQRFGRCNRRGKVSDARVIWFEAKDSAPYEPQQNAESHVRLKEPTLSGVSPNQLRAVSLPACDRPQASHVIRRKDLIELFDTTPDLAGNDIDIDRYIRDAEDRSLQVFWRHWDQQWPGQPPALDSPAAAKPNRRELCPLALDTELRDFLAGDDARTLFVWDHLERRWHKADSQRLMPGQTYLLHTSAGGYLPSTGWSPASSQPVEEAPQTQEPEPPEDNDSDALSERAWDSIAGHTSLVVGELAKVLAVVTVPERGALEWAARWHDRGKAHDIFQQAVLDQHNGNERPEKWRGRRDVGKAPGKTKGGGGWWRRYARKHFRHEMASALAALQPSAGLPREQRDLIAYLVAAHHGKVRLSLRSLPDELRPSGGRRFARGVWDHDELREMDLGGDIIAPAVRLSLEPMELGECIEEPFAGEPSWVERVLRLRDELGPFRLAFLEALLRAADERASAGNSIHTQP